jgi:hypothetical protein
MEINDILGAGEVGKEIVKQSGDSGGECKR